MGRCYFGVLFINGDNALIAKNNNMVPLSCPCQILQLSHIHYWFGENTRNIYPLIDGLLEVI